MTFTVTPEEADLTGLRPDEQAMIDAGVEPPNRPSPVPDQSQPFIHAATGTLIPEADLRAAAADVPHLTGRTDPVRCLAPSAYEPT